MKKNLLRKKQAFTYGKYLLLFAAVWLTLAGAVTAQTNSIKICSASDLHYFDPTLLINDGVAFQTYLAQDRKLLAESKAITEALVHQIYNEKPEIFLVTGDLTKDGEKISHQVVAKYLDSIEMNGVTKVFVIPGNHDVNNVDAVSYNGSTTTNVDYISPADFKSIYSHFGYDEATATDPSSLSYLAKPKSNLWILGIDVCEYDLNISQNEPVTAGRFKPATYQWVLARLADAKVAGATVIGMMHHGLTEHYTGQSIAFPEYVVEGWDTISVRLADAGLKLMFTGHYHANDITKHNGTGSNFVYDIETGSTVTWPCPYRVMNLNSNNYFDVVTRTINNIKYNTNGTTFQVYAKDYLNQGMTGIVKYTLMQPPYSLDDATATAMTPHVVNAYAAHYAGDEKMPAGEKSFIDYLAANGQATFAGMLTYLWTDLTPSDNNVALNLNTGLAQTKQTLQFVYTSDAHYGITRARFQKSPNVNATVVNGAMIAKMNNLSSLVLPKDGGVNEGKTVGGVDFVIMTGDIANRQEAPIQSATASWAQFKTDYVDHLALQNNDGQKSKLFLLPGNHDVSDAIGYYKTMSPLKDSASMVNIYNLMMPAPRPSGNYNYASEKIHYSKNSGGIHFMFVNMWPDSAERVWMETDLANVSPSTPVLIFTHDQPNVESKHFTNPNGTKNINATDKFENLLSEVFKDGAKKITDPSTIEQKGFASFVKAHPNIVVYFHGNDNQNNYYVYTGPDNNIVLNTIQVDSPMKGNISATDETKLSFQLISIDTVSKVLTVRECLWNTDTVNTSSPVVFGARKTLLLDVQKFNQSHIAGYTIGDFHQHTTFTDGSYSFDYMMNKNNLFGLNWWANSEHGGGFTLNGLVSGKDLGASGKSVYWDSYNPKPIIGTNVMSGGHQVMWRWQSLRDSSFSAIQRTRSLYPDKLVIQSYEMNVPGHEHGSMGLIANQFNVNPNVNPLAQFEFTFDGSDADATGGVAQGWTKSIKPNDHTKTLEALTWLQTNYPTTSYLIPAHPERQKKYTISHFRDMNNAAPGVCFGFESMPGHQKDPGRGGYSKSAFGGGTYGGTGVFSAKVGGLWDAMLSEGRNWWLFANSDCHDVAGDFFPGEYQKNYTYSTDITNPQAVLDGLRSGNTWVVEGDLIDSLIFEVYPASKPVNSVKMGARLNLLENSLTLHIKTRDPQGNNFNTYGGSNNPMLNHIDIIAGYLKGKITPSDPKYSIDTVATTKVIARFDAAGNVADSKGIISKAWTDVGNGWKEMSLTLTDIKDSMYFRLRGSNFGLNVTNETDGAGNPLSDTLVGANNAVKAFADLWFYSNPIFVKADTSIIKASSLVAENYTTPSWTLFSRFLQSAKNNGSPQNIANLEMAMKNLVAKNKPYNVNMTINGDPTSRMGFTWFTNPGAADGLVQIIEGEKDSTAFGNAVTFNASTTAINNLNYNVAANQLLSLAGIANNTLKSYVSHKAVVTGLKPNTTYSYRVGSTGAYSVVGKFTTAKSTKEPFTFMYFTDTQAQCDSMFDISQRTIHAAKTTIPDAKFALIAGDLVETSGALNSEWEYEQWFETMQDVWNTTPLAPIEGNHDKSSNRNATNHFNTLNPKFDLDMSTVPGSYYSFVYGNALFMALSYEDYSKAGMLDSAANWMNTQVKANPNTKWRIAFFHKTMFTGSSSHQSDADGKVVREKMGPVFDSLKINLALQGHDHVYEVIGPVNSRTRTLIPDKITNQQTVSVDVDRNLTGKLGGTYDLSSGTLYFLNSSAGIKKYAPRTEVQMDAAEGAINMSNYWSLFTGRFGQTGPIIGGNDLVAGDPMFSSINVSTDSISIVTYSVGKHSGVISKFDAFKIIAGQIPSNVNNKSFASNVLIYPNPITGNALHVKVSGITENGPVELKIFNISGTLVYHQSITDTANELTIDCSSLPSGIYLLKLNSNNEYKSYKIVKE
jgi:acid phosphatase type 7